MLEATTQSTSKNIQQNIIAALDFPEMPSRYEKVASAHANTFEWIFWATTDLPTNIKSFTEWLCSEQKLYWITGKAGSGKSTLMKFLASDQRMTTTFEQRFATKSSLICRFFFWNSVTKLQKSREGLLRTLLSQFFFKCDEDMISKIVPRRWEAE